MAAPPKLNAAQMRSIQATKNATYQQHLGDLARPFLQLLSTRVEQALQETAEDPRPSTWAFARVVVKGVPNEDQDAVIGYMKTAIDNAAVARGFSVEFGLQEGVEERTLTVRLTW